MRAALAAVLLVACSQPAPAPTKPAGGGSGSAGGLSMVPDDASPASQEETLAAIQKAMNELDEGAQGCWAVAATDQYDISGDLVMRIDVGPAKSTAAVVRDNVHAAKLAACMTELLGAYRYPPPLYGQTIQLPFQFNKVEGQSVIDRKLVEEHAQAGLSVSVLLDQSNTGNAGASMFELAIAPNGTTDVRVADRAEVVYFLTRGTIGKGGTSTRRAGNGSVMTTVQPGGTLVVPAGTMVYVPKGGVRSLGAKDEAAHVVIVTAPGGREGAARAGAMPPPGFQPGDKPPIDWRDLEGKQYGPAQIFLDASIVKDTPMAASILTLPANGNVPEHVHANETEMLYILEGSGTMTIAGKELAVSPTSVIQIPPNTKHAFAATAAVKALQIYTPPGPEQRFKKKP